MYRQILVNPRDRKFQRVLWFTDDLIKTFELNTVTFGVASAPFLAIRTLHQLASDEFEKFPRASNILKNDLYVDDLICGAKTAEEVSQIRVKLTALLSKGGFIIRKWTSNLEGIVNDFQDWNFENGSAVKILGLLWNSKIDKFKFHVQAIQIPKTLTKRHILSSIASIFDPLGLLGPIILSAKIVMQECWKAKLGWDESVTLDLHNSWLSFANQLNVLEEISIPRCLILPTAYSIELHSFCDASKVGYGACLYVRSKNEDGRVLVQLACSKSRVSPVKQITIPRLELCAALLLSQLINESRQYFRFTVDRILLWSDSEIALQWIQKSPTVLKIFEGNRVAKIQELTKGMTWQHVPGKTNPVDFISRGQTPNQFNQNVTWFSGPAWLSQTESAWPRAQIKETLPLPGLREPICLISTTASTPFYLNFSSYHKLINVLCYVLRWRDRTSKGNLTVPERWRAEKTLLKVIQRERFSKEIRLLSDGRECKEVKFASLNPFIDSDGLLRVGGRLKNAALSYDQRHPILLPSQHHLSDLIIRQTHVRSLHAGIQSTLCTMRQRFWLMNGKGQVRKIVRSCVVCIRHKPIALQEKMSDLPRCRVEQALVFANVGVDFCGPFDTKERKFRNRVIMKSYGCIFVCMTTKAIHLEIVSDLSTESFLAALRRFVGRRGVPKNIYSDNGSNFVGADNQLKEFYQMFASPTTHECITEFAMQKQFQWHFNPPLSPHFGGIWEAAVKSFKHHLKRVVGGQLLTFEQLSTLAVEIESILNSRPINSLSSDPNDLCALTPAHFLIGRPTTALPDPDYTLTPDNRLPSWKFIVKAKQDFWNRWHLEYLNELQRRQKWFNVKNEIKVNSVVLVIERRIPCYQWPLGRVVEVHQGSDGQTRVVSLKIKDTIFKRNITSLCLLPTE